MVIALFIVAFAMVGGGLAALVQGMPYIMTERGWAMVIAGTMASSSGALLIGIAVAAGRLVRIQDEVSRLGERMGHLDAPLPGPRPVSPGPAVDPDAAAPEAGREATPALDFPAGELGSRAAAIAPGGAASGLERSEREEGRAPVADTSPREPEPEPERAAAPASGSSPEAGAMGASSAAPEISREPPPSVEPTVIGTYSSGGNSYVMFSDGSIQADTPSGAYRFNSLDELKDFIAAGGEGGGAARA